MNKKEKELIREYLISEICTHCYEYENNIGGLQKKLKAYKKHKDLNEKIKKIIDDNA